MSQADFTYYDDLLSHPIYLNSDNIVLFCNQSSFDFNRKSYLFDILIDDQKLSRILIPEHGLFSAHQDQVNIDSLEYRGIPCTSLYNKIQGDTAPSDSMFTDADAIVIDVQDAGVRYYTYTTHLFGILSLVARHYPDLPLLIIDRDNPIGSKVEGTIIDPKYTSIIGHAGLIHRHGMSIIELCEWYVSSYNLKLSFHHISFTANPLHFIPPSPNLPTRTALMLYPGQCLWEATTFSEGRGTTCPFELFGHPDLSMKVVNHIAKQFNSRFEDQAILRPTYFIPVFHKNKDALCRGWQLSLCDSETYHTIHGTLFIMKMVMMLCPSLEFWITGPYEFDSPYSAAQILFGDNDLIDYTQNGFSENELINKLSLSEGQWTGDLAV